MQPGPPCTKEPQARPILAHLLEGDNDSGGFHVPWEPWDFLIGGSETSRWQ